MLPVSQDTNYSMGGARKKSVKKPVKKSKTAPKKGGDALSEQLTGLAVPFAFLLAKQGLEALKKEKKKSATPKKSARRATMAGGSESASFEEIKSVLEGNELVGGAKKRKGKKGGACVSCGSSLPQLGGASSLRNLEKLRKNIDNFLKKY